jgi:hypothetical protein
MAVAGRRLPGVVPAVVHRLCRTGIHPGPSGATREQIRLVAAAEGRWRLLHLVLARASLLGIGAVVTLWVMVVKGAFGDPGAGR